MVKVLGVGNILMKDEGFGVRFVERYKEEIESLFSDKVEVVDGGTQTLPLLHYIENASHLFIIDVVKKSRDDQDPGDIVFFTKDEIMSSLKSRIKITSHSGGIHELLATAEFESTIPDEIELIGIIPEDMSKGLEISETLKNKMQALRDVLIGKLKEVIQ